VVVVCSAFLSGGLYRIWASAVTAIAMIPMQIKNPRFMILSV
jgi:hypothetical protein